MATWQKTKLFFLTSLSLETEEVFHTGRDAILEYETRHNFNQDSTLGKDELSDLYDFIAFKIGLLFPIEDSYSDMAERFGQSVDEVRRRTRNLHKLGNITLTEVDDDNIQMIINFDGQGVR